MFMFSLAIQIYSYICITWYVKTSNSQTSEGTLYLEIPLQVPSLLHFGGKHFLLQNLMNQAENLGIDIVPQVFVYLFLRVALNCPIS